MCQQSDNNKGWIRLYRQMTEWRWYGIPNMMAVFIHLLLNANHVDGYCFGQEVKRGQILTSQERILFAIKMKRGALRECLKKLESSGEIVIQATNHYSLITICNYEHYQDSQPEQKAKRVFLQNRLIPTEDEKNQFEEARKAYPGTKKGLDTELKNFINKNKMDWPTILPLLLPAIKEYSKATQNTERKYIKHLSTWINNRSWEEIHPKDNQGTKNGNQIINQNGISNPGLGVVH